EHLTTDQKVEGSTPSGRASFPKGFLASSSGVAAHERSGTHRDAIPRPRRVPKEPFMADFVPLDVQRAAAEYARIHALLFDGWDSRPSI
ncbi:MAG TPA: hypothetical protein PKA09_24585, partial [Geminicoccus sp.]|nr:hypothetical protein [Geminicoccus sp.]